MRVDTDFADAVENLAEYPELGKPGLVSGTRELFQFTTIGSSMRSMVRKYGY
ncbi:hypothetical protein GCM10022249_01880 [Enteractinococcus coprophilus]